MDDKTFELIEKLYNRMEEGFSKMATKDDLAEVKSDLAGVKGDLASVKGDLASVKGSIARLEHDHGQKLDALFDGYKANTEAIQALTAEMQVLKKEVETHEVKLKIVR